MLISARTAPKTAGVDDIFTAIVSEGEKEQLAAEMEKIAEGRRIVAFKRDGTNVKNSELVVLIGVRGTRKIGLDCGACGYANCEEFEKAEKKNGTRLRWSNMCIQVPRPRYSLGFSSKNR